MGHLSQLSSIGRDTISTKALDDLNLNPTFVKIHLEGNEYNALKGGLGIAIVLSIPESMHERETLIYITLGVVMFSLLVNASGKSLKSSYISSELFK